ncbi:RcnB family protein [uncultured Brevundimonas sp.]|uniref:RcnB family protein n=1 Tax=uncultured Brevundimonas sp. TaxID=213418 RepID=UPI0030ECDF65|tara:strand:- start:2653 stop:3198 length:546 start_codon:yes stop_codon:yes gene_type:complete
MNRLARAAVIAVALTTTAAPLAAEAQSRRDRHEQRQDRRDDRRDHRQDRWNDRRDHRADRRDHRWENRRDRRDYRAHQRWDRTHRDWYRGRSDFRDYRGVRNGYWYAPSYGYYRVNPRYTRHRWQRGHTLPAAYRGYYVRDPYVYGLRPAPRGYRYVHAGNDIVLMAVATGLIISVLSGAY